jgi:hypothetical protein
MSGAAVVPGGAAPERHSRIRSASRAIIRQDVRCVRRPRTGAGAVSTGPAGIAANLANPAMQPLISANACVRSNSGSASQQEFPANLGKLPANNPWREETFGRREEDSLPASDIRSV